MRNMVCAIVNQPQQPDRHKEARPSRYPQSKSTKLCLGPEALNRRRRHNRCWKLTLTSEPLSSSNKPSPHQQGNSHTHTAPLYISLFFLLNKHTPPLHNHMPLPLLHFFCASLLLPPPCSGPILFPFRTSVKVSFLDAVR